MYLPFLADISNVDLATLEIRMARSENLPTLPQAASYVLRLADDSGASSRDIEKAIEMDTALMGKILKIANSSYYGAAKVRSLGKAINLLGLTNVRAAVVSSAMQQMVSGRTLCPSFNQMEYWRHCLAVAIASRIIGRLKMPDNAEELYCAGLMHEIGLLAMAKFVPEKLHVAISLARSKGENLLDVQKKVLGYTHVDLGVVLAKNWSLNPVVTDAIQHWGNPSLSRDCEATTAVVAVSKSIAYAIGFNHSGLYNDKQIDLELASQIGIPEAQFGIIGDVIAQEIAKAQDTFQISA